MPAVLIPDGQGGYTAAQTGWMPPQASEELGLTQAYDQANHETTRTYMEDLKRLQFYEGMLQTDAINAQRQWWNMAAATQSRLEGQFLQHTSTLNNLTQQMLASHVERIAAVNGVAIESMLESVGVRSSELMELRSASQINPELLASKAAHAFAQQVNSEAIASTTAARVSADLLAGMREYFSSRD